MEKNFLPSYLTRGNSECEFIFTSERCCKLPLGFEERFTYKNNLIKKFPNETLTGNQGLQDLIKLLFMLLNCLGHFAVRVHHEGKMINLFGFSPVSPHVSS